MKENSCPRLFFHLKFNLLFSLGITCLDFGNAFSVGLPSCDLEGVSLAFEFITALQQHF